MNPQSSIPQSSIPQTYEVIRETWLSKKPRDTAFMVGGFTTLFIFLGAFLYWSNWFGASDWMSASSKLVFGERQYWRLWTTLFVHADERHLLSNCFLFFILGSMLHGYFGLLSFPLMTFVFGGITNLIVLALMPPETYLIGASGMVFWLGSTWLCLYFLIDTRRTLWQRFLRAAGVGLALFMPEGVFDPSVSYLCHFVGFLWGLFYALIFYYFHRKTLKAAELRELILEEDEDFQINL